MKKILPILFILIHLSAAGSAWAVDYYLTQTASGGDTGADCSNAHSATWFNTTANWGSGAGQIGPGTTVHVCGTWTGAAGSTLLTFRGDGAAGNIVTLLFEPGAVFQAPYFAQVGGAINLNAHSHLLIDGGATCGIVNGAAVAIGSCNGVIKNTADGTNLAYQQGSSAIYSGGNPADIEIRNLVTNMYVRVDSHNNSAPADGGHVWSIWFDHSGFTNVRIHHNNIQGDARGIVLDYEYANASGIFIYNNYIADMGWGIGIAGYGNGTSAGNIQIYGNEITNWNNWVSPSSAFHSNGMYLYDACLQTAVCSVGDSTSNIYANYIHGDLSGGFSGSSPSGHIHVSDNAVSFKIFNNRLDCPNTALACQSAVYWLGCDWGACGGGGSIYNNTMNFYGNCINLDTSIPNTIKNNVMENCNAIVMQSNSFNQVASSDYNDGYNLNGSNWICNNALTGPPNCLTLAQYQAQLGQDAHSVIGDPKLDANDRLQAGSAAVGFGANLTALGIAALDSDAANAPRPASGGWDAGAYQLVSTWYVRQSCANNGNGASSACAATTGAAGAWHGFANIAWASIKPGDTLYLVSGETYAAPLNVGASGTSGAPVTISVTGGGTSVIDGAGAATGINLSGHSYIVVDGLYGNAAFGGSTTYGIRVINIGAAGFCGYENNGGHNYKFLHVECMGSAPGASQTDDSRAGSRSPITGSTARRCRNTAIKNGLPPA